jgi:hypothetical protein
MTLKKQVLVNVRELSEKEKRIRKAKCAEFEELLFEMDMTISQLSLITDFTVSTIYRWCTDTPPSPWTLKYVRAIRDVPELREHLEATRRKRIKRYGKSATSNATSLQR